MYIKITNLGKTYTVRNTKEKVQALKNINLEIDKGEIVGIIGLNGAGKTTLMKILAGIIKQTEGEIRVGDYVPYDKKKEYLHSLGLVMGQKTQLWWDIGAIDSFEIEKDIYKIPTNVYTKRLESMIDILQVRDKIKTPVRQLSLGERMKLEIILCLLHEPSLLLLDEPTLGLDILSQTSLRNFIYEYNKENKNTILITSHNLSDIDEICNKIILLDKGEVIFCGSKDELYDKFMHLKIISFDTAERIKAMGYMCIKNSQYQTEIVAQADEADNIISHIKTANNEVQSTTVKDMDLESIIRIIYDAKVNKIVSNN